jgi:hypothetical protein
LREAGRKIRLEAQDPDERHRRQRDSRYFRHWLDDWGMIRFSGALTPETGVPFVNRIDTETDRVARAARREVSDAEPRERLAADVLAKLLLEGGGARKSRRAELVLVCDIAAFWRGHTHPGEVCLVIGGGPVPVSVAQDLATEAFIKTVLHDGVDIGTVAHYGRYMKAELRTALGLGRPPLFDGVVCVEEGCDRRYHLSGTTSTQWPTVARPATKTWLPGALPTTVRRLVEIVKLVSSDHARPPNPSSPTALSCRRPTTPPRFLSLLESIGATASAAS